MKYLKYLAPLLMLLVVLSVWGCERKIVVEDNSGDGNGTELVSCFGCHGDENLAVRHAREEWSISKHGTGETVERNRVHDEGYQSCERCHTQEGFIAYITDTEVEAPYHFSHIGCFTCHAPHTNGNLELRVETPLTMPDGSAYDHGAGNLCANCHQSRVDVNTYVVAGATLSSRFGPHHGPQGDMLNGTNGYEYANYNYTNSTHTTAVADGCVDCHMAGAAGYTGLGIGGHTWMMENEEDELENTAGCNATGCHSGLESIHKTANSDYDHDGSIESVHDEVQGLVDSLEVLLIALDVWEGGRPISGVVVDDIGLVGAVYNIQFVLEDKSMGVHNTAYTVGLLQSAIEYLSGIVPEADGFNGGQLYDKFWASETGFSESRQDSRFTDNADFYRCKSCHGWDLIGSAGAYINRGPTATRPNVSDLDLFAFANGATSDELFAAVRNSGGRKLGEPLTDDHPDYSEILTDGEIWDIVKFLKETRIDVSLLYELETTGSYPDGSFSFSDLGRTGDAESGDVIFAQTCSSCHGADGTLLDLEGRSVGEFLRDKAYEMQHKVRFGQLGSNMGAGFQNLSITDLQDLYKALTDETSYPTLRSTSSLRELL